MGAGSVGGGSRDTPSTERGGTAINTTTTTTWSRTERLRRLRAAVRDARRLAGIRRPYRYEIGTRARPQFTSEPPATHVEAYRLCYPDGDDLADFCGDLDEVKPGAVLHLYFEENFGSISWPEWELHDIVVVWVGTADHEPQVIDTRFRVYADLDDTDEMAQTDDDALPQHGDPGPPTLRRLLNLWG